MAAIFDENMQSMIPYHVPVIFSGRRGRPSYNISREQILYLRSLSFRWNVIAKLLGISVMTLYRRRQEFGLVEDPRTRISDHQLLEIVRQIRNDFPDIGEVLLMGQLQAKGYIVTRRRVQTSIRHVDPLNSALRWTGVTAIRQPYSVPGPNSLWHIG